MPTAFKTVDFLRIVSSGGVRLECEFFRCVILDVTPVCRECRGCLHTFHIRGYRALHQTGRAVQSVPMAVAIFHMNRWNEF